MTKTLFERQSALASYFEITPAHIGKTVDIPLPAGALLINIGSVVDHPFDGTGGDAQLRIKGESAIVYSRALNSTTRGLNSPIRYFPDGGAVSLQILGINVTKGHGLFFIEYIVVGRANEVYG